MHLSCACRARLQWIFFGARGVRAGWSVLIFIAIVCAAMSLARFAIAGPMPKGAIPPGFALIHSSFRLAAVLLATAIMGRIEGRSIWSYGLARRRPAVNFLAGWLCGLVCLSLLVGALKACGYLAIDGIDLHGPKILGYGLVWLLIFFLVAIVEEVYFRGYMQATLARGIGFWPAALLISASFAARHIANHGETAAGIVGLLLAGLLFCLLLRESGSLWPGIGFHTAWDWAQSFLYGTPDSGWPIEGHLLVTHATGDVRMSGGTVGPEGSLLGTIVIVGLLVLLWVFRRHVAFLTQPAAPIASAIISTSPR